MAAKKPNPFAKFEKTDKAADKKKGVKESPAEDMMDKKMMGMKKGGLVGKKPSKKC